MDVYVWLPECRPDDLARFIDGYVDTEAPGELRLPAFRRVYIDGTGTESDSRALAELRASDGSGAFAMYLRARAYNQAIIAVTGEGTAVLGLSIDDPDGAPETLGRARQLLDRLRVEFAAPAGLAGVDLPPPRSRAEWAEDDQVQIRVGALPAG